MSYLNVAVNVTCINSVWKFVSSLRKKRGDSWTSPCLLPILNHCNPRWKAIIPSLRKRPEHEAGKEHSWDLAISILVKEGWSSITMTSLICPEEKGKLYQETFRKPPLFSQAPERNCQRSCLKLRRENRRMLRGFFVCCFALNQSFWFL